MTREKHLRLIRTALKKSLDQGFSIEQIAEGIVNRFEFAIEEEMEEAGTGVQELSLPLETETFQRTRLRPLSPAERPESDKLEPVIDVPGSALIVDPASVEGQRVLEGSARPIRLGPRKAIDPTGPARYWSQGDLLEYVVAQTPDEIQVPTPGRKQPITLRRQVDQLPGIDLVKLSYLLDQTKAPESSSQNSRAGEAMAPMPIDIPVCVTFSCFTKDQPLDDSMQEIFTKAGLAYKPKPDHIDSHAPRPVGAIRFDQSNPHDTTPPMPNPVTGKMDWAPGSQALE